MMENNLIREFHFYVLTEYEQEEEFLREKHKNGQRLVKVKLPGFYYFENCEPEDVIYKIDFNPQNPAEKRTYIKMYEDYGWEYMQDMNDFSYFRRKAEGAETEDMDIFSDNESRLDMVGRIFMKRMVPVLVMLSIALIMGLLSIGMAVLAGSVLSGVNIVVFLFLLGMLFLDIMLVKRCRDGFVYLREKYSK